LHPYLSHRAKNALLSGSFIAIFGAQMIQQLVLGTIVNATTIGIVAGFVAVAAMGLTAFGDWIIKGQLAIRFFVAIVAVTLWLLLALTAAMWTWALVFWALGLFNTFELALYFSVVAFTTLGFGDVTLDQGWRLLSGFIAANGLILFGLSTAFLIEVIRRVGGAQSNISKNAASLPSIDSERTE